MCFKVRRGAWKGESFVGRGTRNPSAVEDKKIIPKIFGRSEFYFNIFWRQNDKNEFKHHDLLIKFCPKST